MIVRYRNYGAQLIEEGYGHTVITMKTCMAMSHEIDWRGERETVVNSIMHAGSTEDARQFWTNAKSQRPLQDQHWHNSIGQCRWTDQLQQQFQRQETDTVTERHKDSATETVPLRHSQKNTATVYKRETHIGCPESKLTTWTSSSDNIL